MALLALAFSFFFSLYHRWIRVLADAKKASILQLQHDLELKNRQTAHGLTLTLARNGENFTATLRNESRGPKRIYPPIRHIDLFVQLYDLRGRRYDPPMRFVGHPSDPGDSDVPASPAGAKWEAAITMRELHEEFAQLDGAAYVVARYKYAVADHFKGKRKPHQADDAEVWSNLVRLP
ncbi:hypothetical protein OP10G_1464 [Fimbriimonas ginsengisoli Gsoil 348]|uniref:Uncharacterized protein n=1 Tax=Fimbriimonas ginsengisoli Gsoil 348 TaxID=661478 RepID=A0A068NN54_FIMGI|nr:hypothetical protein OP10G_1464 [Fimbriimonas ginsengisoli Gsoil 348]